VLYIRRSHRTRTLQRRVQPRPEQSLIQQCQLQCFRAPEPPTSSDIDSSRPTDQAFFSVIAPRLVRLLAHLDGGSDGTAGTNPCRWHLSVRPLVPALEPDPTGERAESRSASSTRHTGSSQVGRVGPDPGAWRYDRTTLQTGPSQDGRTELILRLEPDAPPRPFDSSRNRPNLTPLAFTSRVTSAQTSASPERPAAAVTFPFQRDVDSRNPSIRSSKGVPP
jgi:hypothetical protein